MKKTINNRTTRRRTFRALRAVLALNLKVVLIVSMVLSTLLYTSDANTTLAYFYDFEYSQDNLWDAGAIDFVLDDQAWQLPEAVNDLEIGETVSRNLLISEDNGVEATNSFVYRIEIELGDNTSMCQYLDLNLFAEDDVVPVYSGLLTDLVDDASGTHMWPETDEWRFKVSLPVGAPESHGDACDFDIVVSGWQLRHDMPFLGGYHDIEKTINSLAAAATVCTPVGFEYDANGNPILAGQVIDDEFAAWGLNISSENHHNARPDLAIIFDSSNPTGEDEDLGTPNQDFAGPGVGLGGQEDELGENSQSLGNVLITAEDDVDDDNDGYIDDPDDERNGGTFTFAFDDNTWVDYIELLDMEEAGGKIFLHHDDSGSNFDVIDIPVLGNNSFQRIVIDDHDVKTMYIDLPGSGAIDNFCFDPIEVEPEEPQGSMCEARSQGYWKNHEGCSNGTGESIWTSEINALSATYSGYFADITGEGICQALTTSDCPSGGSAEGQLCRAKSHTLANMLNIVSGKFDQNALIAGGDDTTDAFATVGVDYSNTVDEALAAIEIILDDGDSVRADYVDAAYVAARLYTFYESENPDAPMCVMPEENNGGEGEEQGDVIDVVLNEVLPNPEGSDSQAGLLGEWVELYNNGDTEVDLANWYIEDGNGSSNRQTISASNTHTGGTTIGANGSGNEWLVVFMSGAILNNTGDTVSFYNSSDELVDQYVYGNHPNDGDDDTKDSAGGDNNSPSGSETSVQEGKSDARIPDGTGDWIDPVPTPGALNILTEGQDQQPLVEETLNQSDDQQPEPIIEEMPTEGSEPDDTIDEEESVEEQIEELEGLDEEIQESDDDSEGVEEFMNREEEEGEQEQVIEDQEPNSSDDDSDGTDNETIEETPSDEEIDDDNQQESLVREDDQSAGELVSETPSEA